MVAFGVAASVLSGCSGASLNPVDWWHGLQGGPLADTRPPPPNADAPYPNLGSVPAKPSVPDAAARGTIASGLVADRANAQYAASQSPLQAFPPKPVLPPPRASGGDEQPNATLNAANAPPPPPRGPLGPPQAPLPPTVVTPPRPAPVGPVAATPLAPPSPAPAASADVAPPAPAVVPPPSSAPTPAAAVARPAPAASAARSTGATPPPAAASGDAPTALPGMPDQPPPLPQLAGVALPRAVAPTPPPATPVPAPVPVPVPAPGGPVSVSFAPGSAAMPPAAVAPLLQLAQRHGRSPISVTGFGDAASSEAAVQSSALPLALARARAIADTLAAAGVPAREIRVGAEAQGSGGAAAIVGN